MSVLGVRKEFSDVNTPKTSISASTIMALLSHVPLRPKFGQWY